jgi:hypothetical protein
MEFGSDKVGRRSNRESVGFSPQIGFKMQKDGEPIWDQTTIDRLWVTTQREAMIEAGPPQAAPVTQQRAGSSNHKAKEPAKQN